MNSSTSCPPCSRKYSAIVRPGQRDPHPRSGRLVHLTEHEHRLVEHAGFLHLVPELVALARALADATEGGQAAVLLGDVVDQLHDDHGLADAGAAEQADLSALGVGRQQVDHLDAGLEDLRGGRQVLDVRGVTVDRPALLGLDGIAEVDRLAQQVEHATQRRLPDRDGDRAARVHDLGAARKTVRGVHRDRAQAIVTEVLLHLAHERGAVASIDRDRVVDLEAACPGRRPRSRRPGSPRCGPRSWSA